MRVISCLHQRHNIKVTWVVRGMINVFHVYCFKSVGIHKYKLSQLESLVVLYWQLNCTSQQNLNTLFK